MGLINYVKTVWQAGKSGNTGFSPERFNNIEDGIEQATNELNAKEDRVVKIEKAVAALNSDLDTQTIVVNSYATIYKTGNVCQLQFNGAYDSTFTIPDNCLPLGTQRGVALIGKPKTSATGFSREFVNIDIVRAYKTINVWRYEGNPSSTETAVTITDGYNIYGCITYICG